MGAALLAALGATFGGLGFVTLVGGAIVLARLRGAGLSGTEGVAVVPKQQLLAIGGDQLLVPTILALALTSVWYAAFALLPDRFHRTRLAFPSAIFAVLIAGLSLDKGTGDTHATVLAVLVGLIAALASGAAGLRSLNEAKERSQRRSPPRTHVGSQASFFVPGLTMFVGLILFVALLNYGRSLSDPTVRAAAVVSPSGSGVWGIYVGETSDRVYLGQVAVKGGGKRGEHSSGRMIGVPKTSVAVVVVGPSSSLKGAEAKGRCLLRELQTVYATLRARARVGPLPADTPLVEGRCRQR